MTQKVDLGDVTVYVTPPEELEFPMNIVAAMISGRISRKLENENIDIEDDVHELLSVCIEGQIQKETVSNLGPHELAEVLGVVYGNAVDMGVDGDGVGEE